MERSRRRKHSDWKNETRKLGQWFPHLQDIINLPGFDQSLDDQMWAIGGFLKYRSVLNDNSPIPEQLEQLENKFCHLTNLHKERFLHLIQMPQNDPVESLADIRSSLKATRRESTPLLPGEELYPRSNWLGSYLEYTQETAAPRAYHFWFGVALLGAACRRNVYMELGYRLYPNQYLFIVGNTAEGKGIAFGKATPLMWKANEQVERDMLEKDPGLGPLEGCYPLRRVVVLPDKPTPQYLVSALVPQPDYTPQEGLAVFRGLDSVGWLANEEVSSWLGKRGDVYEGCVNIITAFYNCERDWSAGTHARGVERLRNMCLTVICGSNLEWINKSVTPDMFAGGFIRRCMFISRENSIKRTFEDAPPPPLDSLHANVLAGQMAAWMQLEESLEIELTPQARRLYSQFNRGVEEKKKEPEDSKLFYYYHGKYNFVMKLAMVLAVNRFTWPSMTSGELLEAMGSIQMRAEDLEQAIALVEFEEQYLPECFARIGEHASMSQYRKILAVTNKYHTLHNAPIPHAILGKQIMRRGVTAHELNRRLDEMVELAEIRRATLKVKRRTGRPPVVYWNPEKLTWEPPELPEEPKK